MDKKPLKFEVLIQKIVLVLFGLGIIGLITFAAISIIFLAPVDSSHDAVIEFTVNEGWTKNKIATELENANLIRNVFFFKFYMKINDKELYAGTYKLSKSMSVDEIIRTLNSANSVENETILITFIEGRRLTSYVRQISEVFGFNEEEILTKLASEEYLRSLIERYWFVTDAVLNKELLYPLEGYFFADTYILKKNATIDEVLNRMLVTMDEKLSIYKEEIAASSYNIHQLLTLASIVELEGINSADRSGVAAVFYNRLNAGMRLGSDVTTYYAEQKDFSTDLTQKELDACNPYNTRGECVAGLPVGPIASASLSSITGAIIPEERDDFYFFADKNNVTHFNKTYSDHVKEWNKLDREGLLYKY